MIDPFGIAVPSMCSLKAAYVVYKMYDVISRWLRPAYDLQMCILSIDRFLNSYETQAGLGMLTPA